MDVSVSLALPRNDPPGALGLTDHFLAGLDALPGIHDM